MKKTILSFTVFYLLQVGCGSKELSSEEALHLIKQEEPYPKSIDLDIYLSDPQFARKALDAGLEKEGLLSIQRTQKLSNAGKPLIQFTPKAQPYLISTPPEDRALDIQKVKIADADIVEVTDVKQGSDGKNAVVQYTTVYKNVTPFAALTTLNIKSKATQKAHFSLFDDGWRLEKK